MKMHLEKDATLYFHIAFVIAEMSVFLGFSD